VRNQLRLSARGAVSNGWRSKRQELCFEYCVDPKDEAKLIEKMKLGMGFANFNNLFAGINVEKANAFKASDQAAILQLMKEIGVKEVNDVIMFSLKDWLLKVATKGQQQATFGTKEGTYLLNAKATLHRALVCTLVSVDKKE